MQAFANELEIILEYERKALLFADVLHLSDTQNFIKNFL